MSSSIVEQGGKICLPPDVKERIGVNDGDEVEIDVLGSSLLIRFRKKDITRITSLKGCIHDSKTDLLTVKSLWKM